MVRDMDLAVPIPGDSRRIEVLADGLALFGGVQLAIDTTLVSPLHADGTARPGAARNDGVALRVARRRKERRYPELSGHNNRCRLGCVGPGKSEGDGPMKLARSSGPWHGLKPVQNHRCYANGLNRLGDSGGGLCSPARPPGRLLAPWWTFECRVALTGTSLWLAKLRESSGTLRWCERALA